MMQLLDKPVRTTPVHWTKGDGNRNQYWIEGVSDSGHDESRRYMYYSLLKFQLETAGYKPIHSEDTGNKCINKRIIWWHKEFNMVQATIAKGTQVLHAHHIRRDKERYFLPAYKLKVYGSK